METTIRKGQSIFFGDASFTHGISRSGYFNKRESEELAIYGKTFEGLQNGILKPENEEETQFVAAINANEESPLYAVKLWKKYLATIKNSRVHHGFSMSNGKSKTTTGNDYSFS